MPRIAACLTADEARAIARRAVPHGASVPVGKLTHYPMTGVVFELAAARGPAARLAGQRLHALVDRATGQAFSCDPWALEEHPATTEAAFRLTQTEAITAARRALATQLLRRVRLGGHFELKVCQIVDPLWKPNWYFETAEHRVLVDALDGSFTVTN